MDSQTQMKQVVADAAIKEVKSDMILGLGSGSTAALMIKSLADEMRSGTVSYTHLRAHETYDHLVCRLLLEKKLQQLLYSEVFQDEFHPRGF